MNKIDIKEYKITMAVLVLVTTIIVFGCKKQDNNDVRVTTYTPQDITQTSAVCGGDVIVTQGLSLNMLGVCWGTQRNPTVEDAHFSTTNWSEPYVCTIIGLEPGTKYHVRAYALRGLEYYYGEDKDFTTKDNSGGGGLNGHTYVDLGLPSGTLWATCNVGATTPEDYGDYFAWGETAPKTTYNWRSYHYCYGGYNQLTKYCNNSDYGYNGHIDNLTMLQSMDDAATAHWGGGWRMPTYDQWVELFQYTTLQGNAQNGVIGYLLTATNGNNIFLPAAGRRWEDELDSGVFQYWSRSLYTDDPSCAWFYSIYNLTVHMDVHPDRFYGLPVRAVRTMR